TVVFQPHLYSRTRDFAPQFAEALSEADEVVLLPIYPARELPMPGVTSELILSRVTCAVRHLAERSALADMIAGITPEILLTAGAGDINPLLPEITSRLS
ncbi:MAG: UDP-N-acetylmuramate--L-alanine ligase, partial [Muribaculaceae bacterium]|nr:UDP-N-acetylmuramate--L-alanine ligase [Muribaculaceae bacterium]